MSNITVHEPLFHVAKRSSRSDMPIWKSLLIRVFALLLALVVVSIIVIVMVGENPFGVFAELFKGSFGSERKRFVMLQELSILLCFALAVTPAFKMKFWNIGAEGQVLVGALGAIIINFYFGKSLNGSSFEKFLLIMLMLITAIVAGAIWAVIPAIFKAFWNTNETLFTLMMNYIAMCLVQFFINTWVKSGSGVLTPLATGRVPEWFDNRYVMEIIIAMVLTILMFCYLRFSKQGYEISVVGESENTARYIGINVKKVVIRTLVLSGVVCGLTGFMLVSMSNTITTEIAAGRGFTAILVSWLAKFNPFIMILTSFLVVFLQKGAGQLATTYNSVITADFADIITGIIFFFIIGCEFFIVYTIKFRKKNKGGNK